MSVQTPNINYVTKVYPMIKMPDNNKKIVKKIPEQQASSIFDKLSTNIKNSRDVNDTVKLPRCIFKGYLCFMLGATLTSLSVLSKKAKKLTLALQLSSFALTAYGTYNFVKPYLFKNSK